MKSTSLAFFLYIIKSTYGQSSIGGTIAPNNRYPYIASLRRSRGDEVRFLCGASIINERWLLTAAHCATTAIKSEKKVTAVVGTNCWKCDANDGGVVYDVGRIVVHEGYKKDFVHSHDIAVIQVTENIIFTKKIQPIKLPQNNMKDYVGETAILIGWGSLTKKGPAATNLQHVKLSIISNTNCSTQWKSKRNHKITPTQLCTSGLIEQHIATNGDSGGPLVSDGVQIGLVSFAWDRLPDVFTRVSSYLSWINKHVTLD